MAYDPCYHRAGDTYANVSVKAISEMSDAAADAVLTLARTRTGLFDDGSFRSPQKSGRSVHHGHALVR